MEEAMVICALIVIGVAVAVVIRTVVWALKLRAKSACDSFLENVATKGDLERIKRALGEDSKKS